MFLKFSLFPALLACGVAVSGAANAQSNTTCTGTLAAGTYDNVTIPDGQVCHIGSSQTTTTITGNLIVGSGSLLVSNGGPVNIEGSLISTDSLGITLISGTTIDENILVNGISDSGLSINQVVVGGNVTILNADTGSAIDFGGNTVSGNVSLQNNSASAGILVPGNMITGNLVCAGNTPAPDDEGSPNTVAGRETGQCAASGAGGARR